MEGGLMDDSFSVTVGKVKWFDPARRRGMLGTIAGDTYFFECGEAPNGLPPLEPGALVTFSGATPERLVTQVQPI